MLTMGGCGNLLLFGLVLCVVLRSSHAHLCLLTPRQRGDLDISKGGSRTCFRHGAECGGQPAQLPPETALAGGQPVFIKWQQNFNHYNLGFPGYMDLAIAENISTAAGYKLGPFTTLTIVPDPFEYDQDHQRNYTAVVNLPNRDCDHCVIRARYVAHKPGETTFYQCADVRVKAAKHRALFKTNRGVLQLLDKVGGAPKSGVEPADRTISGEEKLRRVMNFVSFTNQVPTSASVIPTGPKNLSPTIYGMANFMDDPFSSSYFSVDPDTGEKVEIGKLDFRVDSSFDPIRLANGSTSHKPAGFVPDGVFSTAPARGVTVMPFNSAGNRESFPGRMIEIQTATGKTLNQYKIESYNKTVSLSTFSAVLAERENSFLTFSIEPAAGQQGKYDFVIGRLSKTGLWQVLVRFNQSENTYVNFQWAEFDTNSQTLYVLVGNENDPDHMSARIYKFSLPQGYYGSKMTYVELDVSEYTFMSFHVNIQNSNHLWAISPGVHSAEYPAYHLVDINTDVGSVWSVAQLTPPGIFERYYGGTVSAGGPGVTNHHVRHVLRVADTQADVILSVDTLQLKATFSPVTNLRDLRNLVYA